MKTSIFFKKRLAANSIEIKHVCGTEDTQWGCPKSAASDLCPTDSPSLSMETLTWSGYLHPLPRTCYAGFESEKHFSSPFSSLSVHVFPTPSSHLLPLVSPPPPRLFSNHSILLMVDFSFLNCLEAAASSVGCQWLINILVEGGGRGVISLAKCHVIYSGNLFFFFFELARDR